MLRLYDPPIEVAFAWNGGITATAAYVVADTAGTNTTERVLVSTEVKTYTYVYNGGSLMQETITTTVTTDEGATTTAQTLDFAYDAGGLPMSVTCNGETYYYVTNLQGDVTDILDDTGTAVVTYTYDAWGNILTTTGSLASTLGIANPLCYRSYVYDAETGLYYVSSRYYDPEIGRWINADNTAFLGADGTLLSYNLFVYCKNNPVIGYDPTGHWDWGGVIAGLTIFTIGTAALALTIATCGAAAPAVALAVSSVGTIASAATIATGFVVTTGAATDATIVSDFTFSVGGVRKGVSIVTDFKNDTCEIYSHPGAGTSDAIGISYSTGYVFGYEGLGSYSGDFVEGGVSAAGYSISYSQDPGKAFNTGCRAACVGFSSPGDFSAGLSYDNFIAVYSFSF